MTKKVRRRTEGHLTYISSMFSGEPALEPAVDAHKNVIKLMYFKCAQCYLRNKAILNFNFMNNDSYPGGHEPAVFALKRVSIFYSSASISLIKIPGYKTYVLSIYKIILLWYRNP